MSGDWGYISLPGVGSLSDPEVLEKIQQAVRTLPKPWVHLQVLLDDINGRLGYTPEWSGNLYAKWLLEAVPRDDCVDVTFDGFDHDPREVFQIPEVCRFCHSFLGRFRGSVPLQMISRGKKRKNLPVRPVPNQEREILKRLLIKNPSDGPKEASPRIRIFAYAETLQKAPLAFFTASNTRPGNFILHGTVTLAVERILARDTKWPGFTGDSEGWGAGKAHLKNPNDASRQ